MKEIEKSLDEIKNLGKKICDLRSSVKFSENVLEEKVKNFKNDVKTWRQNCKSFSITKQIPNMPTIKQQTQKIDIQKMQPTD